MISGRQKYNNYKEQFKRLNRALSNGFNLEAMFIEYAIIEDRTESILHHAERWEQYMKRRKGRGATLDSKVKYIQNCANSNPAGRNRNDTKRVLRSHRDPGEDAGGLGGGPAEAAGIYPEADRVSADV